MYQLFIANKNYSSWSLRPWVLMRTLGIAFEEQLLPFGVAVGGRTLRDVSPTGKVPCLKDADTLVWESLAIVEYLAERHAGVWPNDAPARAWARCASSEMHAGFSPLRNLCSMSCGQRIALPALPAPVEEDLARLAALWEEGLDRWGGPFLAGPRFTAVDAFFAPVAFRVQTYGLRMPVPSLDYVIRLLGLPAMREWYAAALKEPWRDEPHEAQLRAAGRVTEDLRVGARA